MLRWPQMAEAEKRELYTKYACHELNFFLARKDPEFFRAVVQPYLRQKLHKTFMDHYLLEDDLASYLAPWSYGRLNVAERILLAQRIDGEAPRTAEHLTNAWNLIPPDMDRFNLLFDTALKSQSLSEQDQLGLVDRAAAATAAGELLAEAESGDVQGGGMGGFGAAAGRGGAVR